MSGAPDLRAYDDMLYYHMAPLAQSARAALTHARAIQAYESARASALESLVSTPSGALMKAEVDIGAGVRVAAEVRDTSRAVLFDVGVRQEGGGIFLEMPALEALARARAAAGEASSAEALAAHRLKGVSMDIVSTVEALDALRRISKST